MKKRMFIVIVILAFTTLACSFTLPFSLTGGNVGETQTMDISESSPGSSEANLNIEMGGGKLNISSGAQGLVEGNVRYNIEEWKPKIVRGENDLTIRQDISTIPIQPNANIVNEWNLKLGSQPMQLTIHAGAYDGNLDFSGISLTSLSIQDGASNATIDFNSPNPVRMQTFEYQTGASDIEISGIANANAAEFTFKGGAGKAVLDFSGTLMDDMSVTIEGGVGDIRIIVPQDTQCVLNSQGALVDIKNNGWDQNGNTYSTAGSGATIEITADLSVGSLTLDIQ